jgi:NO-binding membrane sensor protein with MHYT domain
VSFFVPIAVLLAAFLALGTNERVSWIRISAGGLLCGVAVCGMHYLGNASIANYRCIYHIPNIIGAAITAVAANFAALSMFFVFRSTWTSSWWKRWLSAVIMAGAVSGMHWCAAVGTEYKLLTLKPVDNGLSRNSTVIIVICLVR